MSETPISEDNAKTFAEGIAAHLGYKLTEVGAKVVPEVLQTFGRIDADRNVFIDMDGGRTTLQDWFGAAVRNSGHFERMANAPASDPAEGRKGLTARSLRLRDEQRRAASAAFQFEGPNPWSADAWNLTKQAVVTKRAPDLAARLKAEAGR